MAPQRVHEFLTELFADDMHASRVLSLSNAVSGTIQAAALSVHAIGKGLALANQLDVKSAIKRVDRLLSNMKLSVWELFPIRVPYLLSDRSEVVLALDWTEFDKDGHATIALNMLTRHGRATPLMWKTHEKSALAKHRNDLEDELLGHFRAIVPSQVKVTILADRGFGDQALYKSLLGANMDFVIRFRSRILVTNAQDDTVAAEALIPGNGRAKKYSNVRVTDDKCPVPAVVCVRAKNMKQAWAS